MLDVHHPHESIHGWRDFLLHLSTITVGLLIALGLEGYVEWLHHRHIVRQAEHSLTMEIQSNAATVREMMAAITQRESLLKQDVAILKAIIAKNQTEPSQGSASLSLTLDLKSLETVSWKTAQATGALTYMPYALAQEYSDIYEQQAAVNAAEAQAARDFSVALGPFLIMSGQSVHSMSTEEAISSRQHIEVLQGQLWLMDSLLQSLGDDYKTFLAKQGQAKAK